MGQPQILIKFKQGDHAYFDIEGVDEFKSFQRQLEHSISNWIMIGPNAILRTEDLERAFYFPDGYSQIQNIPSVE